MSEIFKEPEVKKKATRRIYRILKCEYLKIGTKEKVHQKHVHETKMGI